MTPEAQRIAIAEVCGLKRHSQSHGVLVRWTEYYWLDRNGKEYLEEPDYPNDLNAMHEAEKVLTFDPQLDCQFHQYWNYLSALGPSGNVGRRILLCATASQRAEAFLKTLGLWKD